jgi:hypothetical protein
MAMHTDPEFAAEMRALQQNKRATAADIHARAVARGEIDPGVDPGLIDEIVPAQMFMHCFARGEALDRRYIDHLVDDILMPLLTRRATGAQQPGGTEVDDRRRDGESRA